MATIEILSCRSSEQTFDGDRLSPYSIDYRSIIDSFDYRTSLRIDWTWRSVEEADQPSTSGETSTQGRKRAYSARQYKELSPRSQRIQEKDKKTIETFEMDMFND